MLPSPCEVTLLVETLEPEDQTSGQTHGCHQLAALQGADNSFSWAEPVRFEVKLRTTMVIKVQVVAKPSGWIAWFSGSNSQPIEAFHASTKRLSVQDMQRASFQGAEHFSFDLIDAISAMVIGKVVLKSPLQNTIIRSMPFTKDQAYQSQYGSTCANDISTMPLQGGGLTQYPAQTGGSLQHTNFPDSYPMGGG